MSEQEKKVVLKGLHQAFDATTRGLFVKCLLHSQIATMQIMAPAIQLALGVKAQFTGLCLHAGIFIVMQAGFF